MLTSETRAGAGDAVGDVAVDDLDGTCAAVPAGAPALEGSSRCRLPARPRTRSPARALVVVAAAVLAAGVVAHCTGTGASAAAGGDPAVLAARVRVPMGAVQGTPRVGASGPTSASGAAGDTPATGARSGGWSRYRVLVPVVNLGRQPVRVTVLGVDAPHQRTARVPAPVDVPPGAATTVELSLEVRCADVPPPGSPERATSPASTEPAGTAALARVAPVGGRGSVRVRSPWADRDGTTFAGQLWMVCVPQRV